jgi:AraC family ethanolamine operon transcriptional activator
VERAERLLRQRPGDRISITRLSELVGVSERALRNAFHAVRGMSPKRSMMHANLNAVRLTLSRARSAELKVTDVATEHGFFELGRFAVRYKAVFGESPSATLHVRGGRL